MINVNSVTSMNIQNGRQVEVLQTISSGGDSGTKYPRKPLINTSNIKKFPDFSIVDPVMGDDCTVSNQKESMIHSCQKPVPYLKNLESPRKSRFTIFNKGRFQSFQDKRLYKKKLITSNPFEMARDSAFESTQMAVQRVEVRLNNQNME